MLHSGSFCSFVAIRMLHVVFSFYFCTHFFFFFASPAALAVFTGIPAPLLFSSLLLWAWWGAHGNANLEKIQAVSMSHLAPGACHLDLACPLRRNSPSLWPCPLLTSEVREMDSKHPEAVDQRVSFIIEQVRAFPAATPPAALSNVMLKWEWTTWYLLSLLDHSAYVGYKN